MSGGSFNYLYAQDPYQEHDLIRMADELCRRGMYEAEQQTRALIPRRATAALADLWQAVEWNVSCDWSEAQVADAWVAFKRAVGAMHGSSSEVV